MLLEWLPEVFIGRDCFAKIDADAASESLGIGIVYSYRDDGNFNISVLLQCLEGQSCEALAERTQPSLTTVVPFRKNNNRAIFQKEFFTGIECFLIF